MPKSNDIESTRKGKYGQKQKGDREKKQGNTYGTSKHVRKTLENLELNSTRANTSTKLIQIAS